MPEGGRAHQTFRVPGDVLAGHAYTGIFSVKIVELTKMVCQYTVDLGHLRQGEMNAGRQIVIDLAKYPGASLSSPADHDSIRPGMLEYLPGLFRRSNVAVGNNGNFHRSLYRGDCVIFRMAGVGTSTGTS